MATGIILDKEKQYELIEKIIVGYSLTTSEPDDWSTNYTDYFTNTGTLREPTYTAVTGETAPTWQSGTYYSYTTTNSSTIYRNTEPDGTAYNFSEVIVHACIPQGDINNWLQVYNNKSYGIGIGQGAGSDSYLTLYTFNIKRKKDYFCGEWSYHTNFWGNPGEFKIKRITSFNGTYSEKVYLSTHPFIEEIEIDRGHALVSGTTFTIVGVRV